VNVFVQHLNPKLIFIIRIAGDVSIVGIVQHFRNFCYFYTILPPCPLRVMGIDIIINLIAQRAYLSVPEQKCSDTDRFHKLLVIAHGSVCEIYGLSKNDFVFNLRIESTLERVGGNRRVEERANLRLGVGVLRADVPRGIPVRLRYTGNRRIGMVTGIEEVLAL